MNRKLLLPFLMGLFSFACTYTSCTVEEIDLHEVTGDSLYVQSALDLPVAQVTATIEDIIKHEKKKGRVITPDTTIEIDENTPALVYLPVILKRGTYIEEVDSFMNLPFRNNVGPGHAIDYIESCILKVEVDNTLPFSIDYNVIFLHKDSITGEITEIPELKVNQAFTADPAEMEPGTNTISGSKITKHEFKYNKSHTLPFKEINHIKVAYRFYISEQDNVLLTKKSSLKMKISCYFKGGIFINEYNF